MSTKMSPLQRVNSQMKITCLDKKILRLDKIDFDWRKNRPLTIDFHKKKCSIYYGFLLVSKLVSLYTDQRLKKSP